MASSVPLSVSNSLIVCFDWGAGGAMGDGAPDVLGGDRKLFFSGSVMIAYANNDA
jgi:hypothetical protein